MVCGVAIVRNKPNCVQGQGNDGWCSRMVSSGYEPLLTQGKQEDGWCRRQVYVPRMSHSAWVEQEGWGDMVDGVFQNGHSGWKVGRLWLWGYGYL